MAIYIMLLLNGIWQIYNFIADIYNLPVVSLFRGSSNMVSMAVAVACKWDIVFGVVSVLWAVFGMIFKNKLESDTLHSAVAFLFFSFVVSFCLIL